MYPLLKLKLAMANQGDQKKILPQIQRRYVAHLSLPPLPAIITLLPAVTISSMIKSSNLRKHKLSLHLKINFCLTEILLFK